MRRWLAVAALLAAPHLGTAACTAKQLTPGWLWHYTGIIGEGDRIRLTFTRTQDAVAGVYFHAGVWKDVRVSGKISGDKNLVLEESGGRFDLEFTEHDPRGQLPGTLRCQIIAGTWRKEGAKQKLPVYLSLESGAGGKLDRMYEIAGAKDDQVVNTNALRFWQAVKRGDKATVASMVAYPLRLRISGSMTTIHNTQELLKQYDTIFTSGFRQTIEADLPRNMFANDRGISLAGGGVWFNAAGRVSMVNPR